MSKVLAYRRLEPRVLLSTVSLAYKRFVKFSIRNISFDFSELEWAQIRSAVNTLGQAGEKIAYDIDYKEGDTSYNTEINYDESMTINSEYSTDISDVTINDNNTLSLRYRDLRIVLTRSEFIQLGNLLQEGAMKLGEL